jgi:hypothetical protein
MCQPFGPPRPFTEIALRFLPLPDFLLEKP